uniref:Uncharacterized protein n=1 Tax=Cacopsylla melanoneura TaxID=428564 RepID=A0A8D9ED81_9HEMI
MEIVYQCLWEENDIEDKTGAQTSSKIISFSTSVGIAIQHRNAASVWGYLILVKTLCLFLNHLFFHVTNKLLLRLFLSNMWEYILLFFVWMKFNLIMLEIIDIDFTCFSRTCVWMMNLNLEYLRCF